MSGEPVPLLVDLDGLPRRAAAPPRFGLAAAAVSLPLMAGTSGLVRVLLDGAGLVVALVSVPAVVVGLVGSVLLGSRAHVRLDPDGLRRHDGLRLGRRVRRWSTVREVRPSSRWNEHPELRGTRASDEPFPLAGWTDDDARELGRRLAAAQRSAPDAAAGRRALPTRRTARSTGELVVDLSGLPHHLVAPTGSRRSRWWWGGGVVAGVALLLWHLLSWVVGDRSPDLVPLALGALVLLQSLQWLVLGRRQRVLLRPTGVVAEGAADDQERAWSARTHVRLPSRWQEPPRLLNLGGGPVTLWGLDEQQALLLRRRVEEAVARAAAGGTPDTTEGDGGESDEGQVARPG